MYDFTRHHKLRKADDFSSVFILRKLKYSEYLKINYKPTTLIHSRLGIIVGKKVHKRATKRNYMKRTLRELFRVHSHNWQAYDIIIRINKYFTAENYSQIKLEFINLTKHLNKPSVTFGNTK